MKRSTITVIISVLAIWLCQMIFIVPVFAGTLIFIGEFLNLSTPVVQVTGPLVCPAGTIARVDTVSSDNYSNHPNSFDAPAANANEFNCVDAAGNIVAYKSSEQMALWSKIVNASTWIFLTGFAFLVAMPLGWFISRLMKKNASPGTHTTSSHNK